MLSPVVEKVVFESFRALDMAPTWAVPGLLLFIILVLRKRAAICPSTLYPNFYRFIRSFIKEEAEVRIYCAISAFLTLYPNYIAFYQGEGKFSIKRLLLAN